MSSFLIQYSNCQSQIPCKNHPQKIRYLQICSGPINFVKFVNHNDYQCKEQEQPKECQIVGFYIKEDERPHKVHGKLQGVNRQGAAFLVAG